MLNVLKLKNRVEYKITNGSNCFEVFETRTKYVICTYFLISRIVSRWRLLGECMLGKSFFFWLKEFKILLNLNSAVGGKYYGRSIYYISNTLKYMYIRYTIYVSPYKQMEINSIWYAKKSSFIKMRLLAYPFIRPKQDRAFFISRLISFYRHAIRIYTFQTSIHFT